MSQALFTSMMPRQACCWWSGHSPQSCGQPRSRSVENSSGVVPGLLNFVELVYIPASPYTSASNNPCSEQRLRMYTLLLRIRICASMTARHTGQMLRVSS